MVPTKKKGSKLIKVSFGILLLMLLAIPSAFASYTHSNVSDEEVFTVSGKSYSANSIIQGDLKTQERAAAMVAGRYGVTVPSGYMAVQARLFNGQTNALIKSSQYNVNTSAVVSITAYSDDATTPGQYYSKGSAQFYSDLENTWITKGFSVKSIIHVICSSCKTSYEVNETGETYGASGNAAIDSVDPDLILAEGVDGTLGYVRSIDLNNVARTPNAAVAKQIALANSVISIPLYEKDGQTVIGSFELENSDPQ